MAVQYRITNDDEFSGAIIYLDGEPHTASSDNPNYAQIVGHLIAGTDDDETLRALLSPAAAVAHKLTKLTERVSYKGGKLYLDGDLLNTDLGTHLLQVVSEGDEKAWKPLALFLEKLSTNPSKLSRSHLWKFTQANRITIHEDGDLLLYKGLRADGFSINRGYGIVDGEEFGEYNEATNRITKSDALPNHTGAVVEIPRSMVDPDRNSACSTGLHAGAHAYAKSFAQGKLVTVKINPRDVVSVPHDASNQKVRVCRYVVFEEKADEYTGTTVYEQKPAPVATPEDDQHENFVSFEESTEEAPTTDEVGVVEVNGETFVGVIPASAEVPAEEPSETSEPMQALTGVVQPPVGNYYAEGTGDEVENGSVSLGAAIVEDQDFNNGYFRPQDFGTPDESDDDTELSDEQIKTNQRLEAYKVVIQKDLLPRGESLKRYRNKRVTAGRRGLFDKAVSDLGLSY